MNTKDIFQEIIIDSNPSNSMVAKNMPPDKALGKALSEILTGLQLNFADLPFYVIALETLAASLKNEMEQKCMGSSNVLYNYLSSSTRATSISMIKRSDSET